MGEPATDLPVNKLQDQPYHELYKSAKEEVPMFEGKHTFTAESFLTKLKASRTLSSRKTGSSLPKRA